MKWEKKGLVYSSTGEKGWRNNSALQPTPLILEDRIRIYAGFRDEYGVSRIGYIDSALDNPSKILGVSSNPVLDIGKPGMFDDNGVVPTCVIKHNTNILMYYAGYSLGEHVRFLAFTGLAISSDGGYSFKRYKETPITDRTEGEELFRVIHSLCFHNGSWKVFYGAGNHFIEGKQKTLPVYDIRLLETTNQFDFSCAKGNVVISVSSECHRVGRPYVFNENNVFKMYYGYGSEKKPYQLAYAESDDGNIWKSVEIGLRLSETGWDSEMMAYPAFVKTNRKRFLFYNGNNYGREGFGYAELIGE
jgi:hypothetical protein